MRAILFAALTLFTGSQEFVSAPQCFTAVHVGAVPIEGKQAAVLLPLGPAEADADGILTVPELPHALVCFRYNN